MDFLTGLKTISRYCRETSCGVCKISCNIAATLAEMDDEGIAEIASEMEQWFEDHPVKTMEDVLFETFPAAKKLGNGCLRLCPDFVVPEWQPLCKNDNMRTLGREDCKKCWRRPVPCK